MGRWPEKKLSDNVYTYCLHSNWYFEVCFCNRQDVRRWILIHSFIARLETDDHTPIPPSPGPPRLLTFRRQESSTRRIWSHHGNAARAPLCTSLHRRTCSCCGPKRARYGPVPCPLSCQWSQASDQTRSTAFPFPPVIFDRTSRNQNTSSKYHPQLLKNQQRTFLQFVCFRNEPIT